MEVLIVNPGNQRQIYQHLADERTAIEPPIWARLIASYLLKNGVGAEILDANALGLTPYQIALEIWDRLPCLVVMLAYGHQPSASTQQMPAVIDACEMIKSYLPVMPVIVVGGHPAALPERTLRETGADFVCTGEGPAAILGLVEWLGKGAGRKLRWASKADLVGVCYWDHDEVIFADPASNVQDMSEMPGGCWEMLPMNLYRSHNWHALGYSSRQPYASIYTSLGCPYSCGFCMIQSPFREGDRLKFHGAANSYRLWHPSIVLDELTFLQERYGVKHVKIADEMYVLNPGHVDAISQGIIDRGLDLNIWAYARVDTVKAGLLPKMKRAGVNWLALGIESASEHVRDGVEKADYGKREIIETCRIIREEGINIIGNFIFGLPDDTRATMEETLDLAQEIMPEWVNMYPAQAYPGSKLYQQALTEGWPLPDSWLGYSMHSYETQPLPTRSLSAAEVLEFSDNAFYIYFMNDNYLAMMRRKFGDIAVEEIEKMTAKRLPRRLLDERELTCAG